ncbi:MAG: Frr, ribosome recycling factor [Parcubacteria group bacterium]|nr:Frr, ribosome recycling factor [Parcubacteria group bacterium]
MAYDFSKLNGAIKETEEWLMRELSTIRTGRAVPSILDNVKPEAYGTKSPLTQIASVSVEDARSIRVVPWDKTLMRDIEKAIVDADLGVGVSTDDQGLRVTFPELTGERRTMLLKVAGEKTEQARVTLRGHRAATLKDIEAAEKEGGMGQDDVKRYKDEVQKLIDKGGEALDALLKKKEVEISN